MKKRTTIFRRFFVQFASLLLLISLNSYSYTDQTGGGSGVNILQSVGSCSGVSSSGSLSGSEDSSEESSGSFITGEPFDIPAPIAKGSEGIDPTSIEFSSGSGGRVIKETTTVNSVHTKEVLAQTSNPTVGTLSFSTIDNVEADVAIIIDGVVDRTVETTGGSASTDISEDELGIPIGLAVINGTPEAIESFDSMIPIVTINSPTGNFEDFTVSINITNVDEDTVDPDGLDGIIIDPDTLAYSNSGRVAFSAQDSDGTSFVGTIVLNEGVPELLTDEPPNGLRKLSYFNNILLGVDPLEAYLYQVYSVDEIYDDRLVITESYERDYCISPDNQLVASNIKVDGLQQMVLRIDNIATGEMFFAPTTLPEPAIIIGMSCDYDTDGNGIVVIKRYVNSTYAMEHYDITNILDGSETSVTPLTLIARDVTRIYQPKIDPSDTTTIAYLCDMTPVQTDLCLFDPVNQVSVLYDAGAGNVVLNHNFVEGLDTNGIIYEVDMSQGNPDDLDSHAIVIVDASNGDFEFLVPGMKPTPSPTGDTSIVYLSPFFDDTLQVGVMTLR